MRLGLRIFLVYFLFVGLAAWFVFGAVTDVPAAAVPVEFETPNDNE
jgi:hypothetical protein